MPPADLHGSMNAFADMLFSALLGWVRGLTQSLWSFFAGGGSGGFFSWIGDHCLPVTAVLCLSGAAVDLVVRLSGEKTGSGPLMGLRRLLFGGPKEMSRQDRARFAHGYEDGIDMQDLNPDGENHIPLFESNVHEDSVSSGDLLAELEGLLVSDTADQSRDGAYTAADGARAEGETRRRRGDRYDSHERKRLFKRVNSLIGDDAEDGMLDRLPSKVDRKEAFHDPVYPNRRNP